MRYIPKATPTPGIVKQTQKREKREEGERKKKEIHNHRHQTQTFGHGFDSSANPSRPWSMCMQFETPPRAGLADTTAETLYVSNTHRSSKTVPDSAVERS